MPKPEKLYYKIPTFNKEGKIHFNNQLISIKTQTLGVIAKLGIEEYAKAETHSLIRRMAVAFVADEDFKIAKKEINFTSIEENKHNYICIFNGSNEMIVMLRPASRRQSDVIEFEDWEKEQKAKLEKEKAEIQAKADKLKEEGL